MDIFWRKRRLQQKYQRDRRVLKKNLSKLSESRDNKVSTMLDQATTAVMKNCKAKGYGIVYEDLRRIRNSVNRREKRFNPFNGKVLRVF